MARRTDIDRGQLTELLLQMMETELGGEQAYETALSCVSDERLRREWSKYLEQTRTHQAIVRELIEILGGDPEAFSPGRSIVRSKWLGLVGAMEAAREASPEVAQLVACEGIVEAETKDHLNWELLSMASKALTGDEARAVRLAVDKVEDQEDEHLYHSAGWCRELWLASLGLEAEIPPPEERRDVRTAISAARAARHRHPTG